VSQGAGGFQPVDDAERAIQPPGMILRLQVAAGEQLPTGGGIAAIDIADTVDRGRQSGLGQSGREPVAGLHILRREGRAVHACLVLTDFAQRIQVTQQSFAIDGWHGHAPGPGVHCNMLSRTRPGTLLDR